SGHTLFSVTVLVLFTAAAGTGIVPAHPRFIPRNLLRRRRAFPIFHTRTGLRKTRQGGDTGRGKVHRTGTHRRHPWSGRPFSLLYGSCRSLLLRHLPRLGHLALDDLREIGKSKMDGFLVH